MRRILLCLVFTLGAVLGNAQEVTEAPTRNVLLEVFTGITCSWCPEGDEVSAQLAKAYPDQVFVIDVHAGYMANPGSGGPDYRTAQGDSIHDYYAELNGGIGYPSGLLNRRQWGSWLVDRNYWGTIANVIMAETSPVELNATAHYDGSNSQLTVNVEGEYLTDTLQGTQRLAVALTQDGIIGPQNGSLQGENYVHNHVLRTYLTSVYGDSIGIPAKGEKFQRTYTYTVPEDYKEITVMPEDLNVVVFLADNNKQIEQVVAVKPTIENYAETLAGQLSEPDIPIGNRYGYNFFEVNLKNKSVQHLTSATFEVTVNGETAEKEVSVDIDQFATKQVTIPATYTYAEKGKTKYSLILTKLNGEEVEPDTLSGSFSTPKTVGSTIYIQMMTDYQAAQNHFWLKDADGNMLQEFGPFEDGNAATYYDTITVEDGKTYCLEVTDLMGDGLNEGQRGGLILHSAQGTLIDQFYQITGYGTRSFFIVDDATAIREIKPISSEESVSIYTLDGRKVNAAEQRGVYIMKEGNQTKKFIKQ